MLQLIVSVIRGRYYDLSEIVLYTFFVKIYSFAAFIFSVESRIVKTTGRVIKDEMISVFRSKWCRREDSYYVYYVF